MNGNKYKEFDEQVNREVMKEFSGKVIPHVCDECNGKTHYPDGETCKECKGAGFKNIQY